MKNGALPLNIRFDAFRNYIITLPKEAIAHIIVYVLTTSAEPH